jgi:hypothetical protein
MSKYRNEGLLVNIPLYGVCNLVEIVSFLQPASPTEIQQ